MVQILGLSTLNNFKRIYVIQQRLNAIVSRADNTKGNLPQSLMFGIRSVIENIRTGVKWRTDSAEIWSRTRYRIVSSTELHTVTMIQGL